MFSPAARTALLCASTLLGCSAKSSPQQQQDGGSAAQVSISPKGKVLEAAENEGDSDAGAHKSNAPAAAESQISIPSGALTAGSTPGDKGRDPVLEPALLEVDLGGFSIDRYLYPNDPQKPPLTGIARARAAELCRDTGGRLCTELEWERACKGPDGTAYPGSASWDPACATAGASCASGFGVLGMGAALREWTASDVAPIENMQPKAAAVRGVRADAVGVDHRCAHRTAVDASQSSDDIGFRCCRGAPNAVSIPSPQWDQTFRRADLTAAQAKEMFAAVPQLVELGTELTYFKEPDDVTMVLARGDAGTPANTILTTSPLVWNPVPGEQILVVAGRADKDSFIVAFYRLPKDRYRIASSFIMKDEDGPIVLGYNGYVRRKLTWGTCWECRGESGHITYRDDNRVVITQK